MALNPEVIKNIIFDLDDTLFDTNGQLVPIAARESCEAMIQAGLKATINECLDFRNQLQTGRSDIFESIVKHFGATQDSKTVAEAGSKQFHNREIKEKITLFPEASEVLKALQKRYKLFLVTLGGLSTQEKKVELLGLARFFNKIFLVDIQKRKTKTSAFKEILNLTPTAPPHSFVSVGNRIDSEIRDAKSLGMQTILFAHGEYLHLKPQSPLEEPDETVTNLKTLLEVFK